MELLSQYKTSNRLNHYDLCQTSSRSWTPPPTNRVKLNRCCRVGSTLMGASEQSSVILKANSSQLQPHMLMVILVLILQRGLLFDELFLSLSSVGITL